MPPARADRACTPSFVAGHSLGEYSAHVAAGTLQFADAVRLVRNRGRYMQEAVPVGVGAMAAILGLDEAGVNQACEEAAQGEVVSPANLNGAGQIVIAGTAAAVARASERAKALGAKRAIPLTVSAPFHCALMKPAEVRLTPELRAVPTADPRVPVVANVDAEPKRTAAASIDALIKQIASPVRWEDVVQRLASEGVTRYVEVGPGKALSGMIKRIASGATIQNVEGPDDLAAIEALVLTSFDGKIAIVTGASRGIGRAIAERLAAGGATVVCVARGTNADATAAAIAASGGKAEAVGADVTDAAAVEGLDQVGRRQARQARYPGEQRRHHTRSVDAAHEAQPTGTRSSPRT